MKRVRFMAAMTMVALLGFTACDNTANNEEAHEEHAENTEMEEADPHAGHDHGDMGEMNETEGMEGEGMAEPVEPVTFDEPAAEITALVNEIMGDYLDIKTSLVQDNPEGAAHAAGPFVQRRSNIPDWENVPAEQKDYLKKALQQASDKAVSINVTQNIEMQRKAFEGLSATMYALAKTFGSDNTLYKQYCPMAFNNQGAYWISTEEEVLNPYFGDAMLKCGRVEETIEM